MKRIIKYILVCCCILTLSGYVYSESTTYEEMKSFTNRDYFSYKGYIKIYLNSTAIEYDRQEDAFKVAKKHADFIEIDTEGEDEKGAYSIPKLYYNPRIIEKNGKKYITADGIPEDILIKNKNLLVLESKKLEYDFVDIFGKEK